MRSTSQAARTPPQRCPAAGGELAPEEVSAQVLLDLVTRAERACGRTVDRAVVAIPAYFKQPQREATLRAAAMAGVPTTSLIAEPVAACLAYGLSGAKGKVLVFDLGAGTFDVSVVTVLEGGTLEVVATSGDANLGGSDFDAGKLTSLLYTTGLAGSLDSFTDLRCTHSSHPGVAGATELSASGKYT